MKKVLEYDQEEVFDYKLIIPTRRDYSVLIITDPDFRLKSFNNNDLSFNFLYYSEICIDRGILIKNHAEGDFDFPLGKITPEEIDKYFIKK